MPRPRPYKEFTDDAIRTAIEDVHGGMSLRKAALLHGLNRQTLANKLAGKHDQKPGRPCALSETGVLNETGVHSVFFEFRSCMSVVHIVQVCM